MSKADSSPENGHDNVDNMPSLEEFNYSDDTDDNDPNLNLFEDQVEEDNAENLSEKEHLSLLDDTSVVYETVSKV
jgi:hypothetical protein